MTTFNEKVMQSMLALPKHRFYVKELRCIWPRRCKVSNKILFLKKSIKLEERILGPGFPVIINHWVTPKAYTLLLVRGFCASPD